MTHIITCAEYRQKGHLTWCRATSTELIVVFSQILSYKCLGCLKLVFANSEEKSSPQSSNSNFSYIIYARQWSLAYSNQCFFFLMIYESQWLSLFLARKMIVKSLKSQIALDEVPKLLNSNLIQSMVSIRPFRQVALFMFCQGSLS